MSEVELYSEFFERFGLNKLDQKVYGVLLGKGVMTPGEINETLNNPGLLEVLESLRDLTDFGLVSVVGDKIKRYYANFPFLREILTIEREAVISLASLITSIEEKEEILKNKRSELKEITMPMFINSLLDNYYSKILQPMRDDLLEARKDLEQRAVTNSKAMNDFADILAEDITKMAVPLEQMAKLSGTKLTLALTEEQGGLEKYLVERKSKRANMLKNTHFQLSSLFKDIQKDIDTINGNVGKSLENVSTTHSKLLSLQEKVETLTTQLETLGQMETKRSNQLKEGLILTRETLVKGIKETFPDAPEHVVAEAERIIRDSLAAFGDMVEALDTKPIEEGAVSIKEFGTILKTQVVDEAKALKDIEENVLTLLLKAKDKFEKETGKVAEMLNQLNINDDELLKELKMNLQEDVKALSIKLSEKVKETTQQLDIVKEAMVDSVKQAFESYSEDLVRAFNSPITILDKYVEGLGEVSLDQKEEFESQIHSAFTQYLEELTASENEAMELLKERIEFAKTMVEGRSLELRKVLRATEKVEVKVPVDNGVIIGLPAIYASLTDLLLRAKRRVTLITPTFDATLYGLTISLVRNSPSTRVTIVTHIPEGKREKEIEQAKEFGTITMYNYEEKDLFACFRDDEEIVFGYKKEGEEVSAIRSASQSMVDLFKDRVNETVIRKSKRVV